MGLINKLDNFIDFSWINGVFFPKNVRRPGNLRALCSGRTYAMWNINEYYLIYIAIRFFTKYFFLFQYHYLFLEFQFIIKTFFISNLYRLIIYNERKKDDYTFFYSSFLIKKNFAKRKILQFAIYSCNINLKDILFIYLEKNDNTN